MTCYTLIASTEQGCGLFFLASEAHEGSQGGLGLAPEAWQDEVNFIDVTGDGSISFLPPEKVATLIIRFYV